MQLQFVKSWLCVPAMSTEWSCFSVRVFLLFYMEIHSIMSTSALSTHIAAIWVVKQCRLQPQNILTQPENKRLFCAASSLFCPLFEIIFRTPLQSIVLGNVKKLLILMSFFGLSFIIWHMSSFLISNHINVIFWAVIHHMTHVILSNFKPWWWHWVHWDVNCIFIPSFIKFCPPWAILWLG